MPTTINLKSVKPTEGIRSPAVVTSNMAMKHLNDITAQHAEIVRGIEQQKQRVDAYNQQKQSELANQNAMNAEMQKEKMANDTQAKKDYLDFAQKNAEINAKRTQLST